MRDSTARSTLEQLYTDRSDDPFFMQTLSEACALAGQKDSAQDLALKAAERAIMLVAQDAIFRPSFEENLAAVQTFVRENSRAISTLTRLLQTSYGGAYSPAPITPELLRLDPIWDPLRSEPAFQKLCKEKQH